MPDLLQRIYQAFGTGPLRFQEDSALYVDLDEARGSLGVVSHLATKIRLADTPTCQALTGHKGSGKSTELRRLKQQLEDPAQAGGRFFVVLCDVSEDIDLNDVDFLEVLVAIVRQVGAQLKAERISVAPGYFKTRWSGLKNLLTSDVKLDEVALDLGMLTLSGALKNSPDLRQRIRKLLEPETTSWLSAANAVMGDARTQLQQRGYLGVVVVVDNLDKMIRRPHADQAYSTAEHLFINRAAQLTAFDCHLVYAIPLELAYSHHEPTVKSLYGGRVPVVPMTRITSPPPRPKPYEPGLKKFREVVAARLWYAGASEDDLFRTLRVRDALIMLSGGQPTDLMTLVRESIVRGGLPIGREALARAKDEWRQAYVRQLRLDHWPILEEVRRTGHVTRTLDNDAPFRELLDSRAILLYRNREEWYGLHPAIADLRPPATAARKRRA